jgi:hypothetical protein
MCTISFSGRRTNEVDLYTLTLQVPLQQFHIRIRTEIQIKVTYKSLLKHDNQRNVAGNLQVSCAFHRQYENSIPDHYGNYASSDTGVDVCLFT